MPAKKRLKAGPAVGDIKIKREELARLVNSIRPNEDGQHTMRTHDYLRMQELIAEIKQLKGDTNVPGP